MKKNADYWIKQLDLTPHPEGGYYKETIRETTNEAQRAPFSSIYFLLNTGDILIFIVSMRMKYGIIMQVNL